MGFVMSSRLAAELDHAFERNGWTTTEVKELTNGDTLAEYLAVRRGTHRIVEIKKEPADPLAEFFKIRAGLYVWSEFTNWILAPALTMGEVAPATTGTSFDLLYNMTDAEIGKKLGNKHVFENAKAFCLYLKSALERQQGGIDGDLLNNGCANIFYVRGLSGGVFTVLVDWRTANWGWVISACRLHVYQWDAGRRAFSCKPEEPKAA